MEIAVPRCLVLPRYSARPRSLGERLTKARLDLGLLQSEAAKLAGIDEMTLCGWELDRRRPTPAKLARLERVYWKR